MTRPLDAARSFLRWGTKQARSGKTYEHTFGQWRAMMRWDDVYAAAVWREVHAELVARGVATAEVEDYTESEAA